MTTDSNSTMRAVHEMERAMEQARRALTETMELIALGRAAIRRVWRILDSTPEDQSDGER